MRRIFAILMALPVSARSRVWAYTSDRLPELTGPVFNQQATRESE